MRPGRPILCTVLILAASVGSCETQKSRRGAWPPADFRVELRHSVEVDGGLQVRQDAQINAQGLVVYRESDRCICSADGRLQLPVYRRVSAYELPWRSIRILSRNLHRAPVKDVKAPPKSPPVEPGSNHHIRLQVTYLANEIDVVAVNQNVGLMNRVVRIINAFLPKDHAVTMPNMLGTPEVHRVQDVPEVRDSLTGAKQFHEKLLLERANDSSLLEDTFALAVAASDWSLASSCVTRIAQLKPTRAAALSKLLAESRKK